MYVHGHDNRFRPIIILDVAKIKKDVIHFILKFNMDKNLILYIR